MGDYKTNRNVWLLVAWLCLAAGVAVGPDGTVYVVDRGNHRVQYFKPVFSDD